MHAAGWRRCSAEPASNTLRRDDDKLPKRSGSTGARRSVRPPARSGCSPMGSICLAPFPIRADRSPDTLRGSLLHHHNCHHNWRASRRGKLTVRRIRLGARRRAQQSRSSTAGAPAIAPPDAPPPPKPTYSPPISSDIIDLPTYNLETLLTNLCSPGRARCSMIGG
jgi:hypothetical protein